MAHRSTEKEEFQYAPPKNEFKGLIIAAVIFTSFVLCWYHALFQINFMRSNWLDVVGTFLILEFLYTGLFITCHDAIHGVITSRFRRLNYAIGYICFSAYAWFDYPMMYDKHWDHHKYTGIVNKDPDFHNGQSIGFFPWYTHFLWEYASMQQVIKMTIWISMLIFILSVRLENILVFMLVCGLCSSFRLFYFGTYLPHRPDKINGKYVESMPWEKTRSSNVNRFVSFLCCYHFDYHWEHHRWPYAPWWDLWRCKEIKRKIDRL